MASVDQLLDARAHRQTRGQRTRCLLFSVATHSALVAAVWFVPELLAKPPEPVDYVSVVVVPPQMLGQPEPPPPPPPKQKVEPEPPPPEPPPPEPEPEPDPEVPVLVEKKKKKVDKPPPRKPEPPPPRQVQPPPRRVGSLTGNPLGAQSNQATLGVEDPNFTYGYYLDRVVAVISSNWVRPPVGALQAKLHFRIQSNGQITKLRVVDSSGSPQFDDAAVRAVNTSSPLPPLPKGYTKDDLGIYLIVK